MKIIYHHRTRATDAQRVHILEIVNAFRNLGHQVTIVGLADAEAVRVDATREAKESGWKKLLRRVPFAYEAAQLGYNLLALPWLWWKVNRLGADFIYERYSLFSLAGVLAARLSGRPLLLEVNSPFALEQHQQKEIRAVAFAHWMERVICNAATKVIVVSGPLRRILVANGVHESKLVLMPNGVNLEHFGTAASSSQLRDSLGLAGKVVIGFVGWFRKWHGLEFLIDAFAQTDLPERGAALLLMGDGPAMPDLRKQVVAQGLQQSVIFTGAVPHERIPEYLQVIDIAVQPAANEYCCPMKILEYMGLAKPIVAPRQENIQELVRDGEDALLFNAGDTTDVYRALACLVGDPERRARLGKHALQTIHDRRLLWSSNAEQFISLVRQAMKSSGSRDTAIRPASSMKSGV